jgi:hypothetical protein
MSKWQGKEKVPIDLTFNILDYIILYIFSENTLITKKSYIRLKQLFDIVDETPFEQDREMIARIFLIKKLLEGYVTKGINNFQLLADYAKGGQYDEIIDAIYWDVQNGPYMSNDDVHFIDHYVAERLKYSFLLKKKDIIRNMLNKLDTDDFNSLEDFNSEFRVVIEDLYKDMRQADAVSQYAARDFITDNESMDISIEQALINLNRPTNIIKTGIKAFDVLLGGGFQSGRVYVFFGMSGGWKSGLLLNIALWAKKYNKNILTKDPTKKPCVLYVTQENSLDETIDRMYSYYVDEVENFHNISHNEVISQLKQNGLDENGVAIKFVYRPSRSINTADLDAMIDDLAIDNYEVIMLVQDYLKRIKPVETNKERHLELGNIVDEFATIAKIRDISVVTASQLNRDAYKLVENALVANKSNISKNLGASHIGESIMIYENADFVAFINQEVRKETGNTYLTVKRAKMRGKNTDIGFFAHEFENGMRLVEDKNLAEGVSLFDLGDDLEKFGQNDEKKGKAKINKKRPKHDENYEKDELEEMLI